MARVKANLHLDRLKTRGVLLQEPGDGHLDHLVDVLIVQFLLKGECNTVALQDGTSNKGCQKGGHSHLMGLASGYNLGYDLLDLIHVGFIV